uniref:RanBD1 domain-containing protein n=1 Tax=Odontella aurita TaxID=265563 RepID=A0A7S4IV98_9STRA|mmetsp:Transcript_30877/g.92542  ORF Transcript_30877/g.92542 Transcript_30877/m.92542 type:complete len:551 (+) Transcript_30877:123-1775(+)
MPDDQQPSKKKRTADVQLTKDDHDRMDSRGGDDDGMIDAKDDPRLKRGTFDRASTQVLKKRRILKVNRGPPKPAAPAAPAAEGGDEKKKDDDDAAESKAKEGAEDEKKEETKGSAEADAGGKDDDKGESGEGEEKKSNPFAAVSFASAAKTNPFAAVNLAASGKSPSGAGGGSTGFGFGAGTAKDKDGDGKEGGEDKPKSVFGSGTAATSGFGATSSGGTSTSVFGSGTAAASGFGAAFGGAASGSVGFGAAAKAAPTTGFGTSVFGATKPGTAVVPKINLPAPKPVSDEGAASPPGVFDTAAGDAANTGEEDEERVFQARVKMFRMVPSEKGTEKKDVESEAATAQAEVGPSVPPATTLAPTKGTESKDDDEKAAEEKEESADDKKKEEATGHNGNDKAALAAPSWKEVGMGPLRILMRRNPDTSGDEKDEEKASDDKKQEKATASRGSYRVVQRRESTPGGPGTKLILNLPLRSDGSCTVTRQAEKYVRLATVEVVEVQSEGGEVKDKGEGKKKTEQKTVLYLFKIKMAADADELQKRLEEACGMASS